MDIEFSHCKVCADTVEVIGKFSAQISELEGMVDKGRYDSESIAQRIISAIASEIASEYLKRNKMEIAKSINLGQITDAIQLKVVEGFSLNH